jgi:hypothetical protein
MNNYVWCVFEPDPEILIKVFYTEDEADKFIESKPSLILYKRRMEIE